MKSSNTTTICASVLAITAMSSLSFSSTACDYHGDMGGFGAFGGMGGFGQAHPLMQRHIQASSPKQLKLEHPRTVVAKVDTNQSIDINYHLPTQYKNASLRFTNSDGLALSTDEEVSIDKLNGKYTLDFVAKKPGTNHILVWVDAMKESLPYSKVQRISVTVD
ncbi:hypothetical protein PN836_011765 [Ningiella sp. W23]|uniref:hypothetical protein n=1 Tax=Ningiella sp. W23 TaxID=3023715 RepID=UPI0037575D07